MMQVTKRNGTVETMSFDKITKRIDQLCKMNPKLDSVDSISISKDTINGIYNGITTAEIDMLSASICASRLHQHPQFNKLAARICISNLHKQVNQSYSSLVKELHSNQLVSNEYLNFVLEHVEHLEHILDFHRDYLFDFFGFKTIERSYLLKVKTNNDTFKILERPQHMWLRTAIQIHGLHEELQNDKQKVLHKIKETYDIMSKLKATHATPTLFNSCTRYNQLSSCFLMSTEDNLTDIFSMISNVAQVSKLAGGIGIALSDLRAKGSLIRSTHGLSEGIIPCCKVLESVARYVTQSGKRLGSIAIYMEPWHADIQDFIELRKNTGDENLRARDIFLALWVPDLFMKRIHENGVWSLMCPMECPGLTESHSEEFEKKYLEYESQGKFKRQIQAVELWEQILSMQIETGMPYLSFKDTANRRSNQQNLGTIKSSNLCVSGDTVILTDKGQLPIQDLVNQTVSVWNGEEFSSVEVKLTNSEAELLQVELNNGVTIKCTPYHKFPIVTKYQAYNKGRDIKFILKDAKDLQVSDKLLKYELPIIEGDSTYDMKYPYTHGAFCGDGTYEGKYKDVPRITLYGDKIDKIKPHLDCRYSRNYNEKQNCQDVMLPEDIDKKFVVPHELSTISCKLKWLAGLSDTDGTISKNGFNLSLMLSSIHKDFLLKIKLMLQTISVDSRINDMRLKEIRKLPDGKGGHADFVCQPAYRLIISCSDLGKLIDLGFETYRLDISKYVNGNRAAKHFIQVKSIQPLEGKHSTYCFTEPKRNLGMFNGVLLGNCNEIVQYSDKTEYGVCNLASISLSSFVNLESKEYDFKGLLKVAKIMTENLDKIIDVNHYPIEQTSKSNFKHRPIGLGVQGLADVYNLMGISFESEQAEELNKKIFATIYYGALTKSMERSQLYGKYQTFDGSPFSSGKVQFDLGYSVEPETVGGLLDWNTLKLKIKKHGTRNSLLTTCMPTASTSQILKNNECIEPFTSNVFVRKTLAGEYIVVNEHLINECIKLGIWNKELYHKILNNNGSVQDIAEIPEQMKQIYKTAYEIKMSAVLRQAVGRAPYIDQSQSMNLFQSMPDFSKLHSSHFYSWRNGLKTGMYYLRTKPIVNAIKFGITDKQHKEQPHKEPLACSRLNPNCEACSG